MNQPEHINYHRIAAAIDYIQKNFKQQPSLDEVAEQVHLSPFHFQRMFSDWAGVSPKKFLQYISIEYAKQLLKDKEMSLFDVADATGLSGTGRLHDLFLQIEGMAPGEFKQGALQLSIHYSYAESPFGRLIIASTPKGICYLAFSSVDEEAFHQLQLYFPNAQFYFIQDAIQQNALRIFRGDWSKPDQIKLHLKGTPFQLKVWEALLKIPMGTLTTYGSIAKTIQSPGASRAVGTAIGNNPVAFLIPCHRVIQSSGIIGGYMWGPLRKTVMIGWEISKTSSI